MAKEVLFKNETNNGFYEERPYDEELFRIEPEFFKNELDDNAHVALCDPFGMFFVDGDVDTKPYYYMRHALINMYRFGGVIELGDSFLDVQKKGDCADFHQRGEISDTYRKREDENGSFVYGFGTEDPYSKFRFYSDHATFEEGKDVLKLNANYVLNGIIDHQASFGNLPQVMIPCIFEGTYRGKNVKGMGMYAMNYQLATHRESILASLGYISLTLMGQREDGRIEAAFIAMDQTGTCGAWYKIDGEPLVSATEVSMEADWYRLPYVDDGTCIFKDAIFRFADKEIHFEGKWGTKGVSEEPKLDKHGQSHIIGSWYEGSEPYKHTNYFTFSENMEAYDYKLEKMGFDIK